MRLCSKVSCSRSATATMTYVHADACVVIGPLSRRSEPGAHDLCADHAAKLTPPVDWQLIRIGGEQAPPERTRDDLLAIADAVREAAGRPGNGARTGGGATASSSDSSSTSSTGSPAGSESRNDGSVQGRKHGHLRIIGDS
nr:DUF3499 domain-containing protein [Brevibacterium aurantiacum]